MLAINGTRTGHAVPAFPCKQVEVAAGGGSPHTREVAGSNPAAPMKGLQIRLFLSSAERYLATGALQRSPQSDKRSAAAVVRSEPDRAGPLAPRMQCRFHGQAELSSDLRGDARCSSGALANGSGAQTFASARMRASRRAPSSLLLRTTSSRQPAGRARDRFGQKAMETPARMSQSHLRGRVGRRLLGSPAGVTRGEDRISLQRPLQRAEHGSALRSGLGSIRLRSTEPKVTGSNPVGRATRLGRSCTFAGTSSLALTTQVRGSEARDRFWPIFCDFETALTTRVPFERGCAERSWSATSGFGGHAIVGHGRPGASRGSNQGRPAGHRQRLEPDWLGWQQRDRADAADANA
jgi:hypothetical protein